MLHIRPDAPNERQEAKRQLQRAIQGTREALITATTVFPFTLFPDTVSVDRERVNVTQRFFFQISEGVSIQIQDILNVTTDTGPFMGSLKISTRFFSPEKPYVINYLWRRDALKIERILQGYIIAAQKGIDCSALDTKELAKLLDDLGRTVPDERGG